MTVKDISPVSPTLHEEFNSIFEFAQPLSRLDIPYLLEYLGYYHGLFITEGNQKKYLACAGSKDEDWMYKYEADSMLDVLKGLLCKIYLYQLSGGYKIKSTLREVLDRRGVHND